MQSNGSVVFENNSALEYGGGMYITLSDFIGNDIDIINNQAEYGGGIFCTSNCNIHLDGSVVFDNNLAISLGGGIIIIKTLTYLAEVSCF